nr:uncharacterized protein LOC107449432 [Parasteatoda tepidariorum]
MECYQSLSDAENAANNSSPDKDMIAASKSPVFDSSNKRFVEFMDGTFFEKINDKCTESMTVGKCVKCLPDIIEIKGFRNCTSNYYKHLKRKHGNVCLEEFKSHLKMQKISHRNSCSDNITSSNTYTQEMFNDDLVKFFSHSMIPLNCIEDPYFVNILEKLNIENCGLKVISRKTLARQLSKCFEKNVVLVKEELKNANHVCTTIDIWSGRKRSFFGATAHWIDQTSLQRRSRALVCLRFSGDHNYERINDMLQGIHDEFGLYANKIEATITDNGSNFVKAFEMFGIHPASIIDGYLNIIDPSEEDDIKIREYSDISQDMDDGEVEIVDDNLRKSLPKHLRCCSHTLNLIAASDVNKAIKSDAILNSIHQNVLSKCNNLWKRSNIPKSAEIIKNTLGHTLSRPGATRWNSLYDALKQILSIKDKNVNLHKALGLKIMIHENEFDYMEEYLKCLKPISEDYCSTVDYRNNAAGVQSSCLQASGYCFSRDLLAKSSMNLIFYLLHWFLSADSPTPSSNAEDRTRSPVTSTIHSLK